MNKFNDIEPEFVEKFLSDLYMDDSLSGAETISRAFDFYLFVKSVSYERRRFRFTKMDNE